MAISQIEMDFNNSAWRFFTSQVEKLKGQDVKSQRRYEIAKECMAHLAPTISAQVVQVARGGSDVSAIKEQLYDSAAEVAIDMADALLKKLK